MSFSEADHKVFPGDQQEVRSNWCVQDWLPAQGCLLTRASIDRCDHGPADEDEDGGRLTRVLQTALDVHDWRRHDFPPQLLAACCRQRHRTVNWVRGDNQSAFATVERHPERACKTSSHTPLLPWVGCVSLVASVIPRIRSSNESPSTSHSARGAEVKPAQNETQGLQCWCEEAGKMGAQTTSESIQGQSKESEHTQIFSVGINNQ